MMKKNIKKFSTVKHCWNTRGVWSNLADKCEQLEKYIHCRNCPIFSSEGKQVLNRAAPVGYLKEWTKSLSTKVKAQRMERNSVLVFRVMDEWFAIQAKYIHEITEKRTIHRIPRNNNKDIAGVVNVSGEVRICYSLASIFCVKGGDDYVNNINKIGVDRFIVICLDSHFYVFYVNQISGLHWYQKNEVTPVPTTLSCNTDNLLSGMIKHNNNKVALVDICKFQSNLEGIHL